MQQQQWQREERIDWQTMGAEACRHAGLRFDAMEVLVKWTEEHCANAIYQLNGSAYLKLFGPTASNQYHVERAMLELLAGREDIPSPDIIAAGEAPDTPPYLMLTEVPGDTAEHVWENIHRSQQLDIAGDLGEIICALHALPGEKLDEVESRWGDRRQSAREFRELLIAQIKATDSVPVRFRSAFVDYLEGEARADIERATIVTHRELAHNHLYLDRKDGAWSVSGIIDWADAMRGPEEWDIAFIWFWMFSRDREAMHRFLAARYGQDGPPDGLARRCLGAILQMFEWDVFWAEIVERCTELEADPVGAATDLLFPQDVFRPSTPMVHAHRSEP